MILSGVGECRPQGVDKPVSNHWGEYIRRRARPLVPIHGEMSRPIHCRVLRKEVLSRDGHFARVTSFLERMCFEIVLVSLLKALAAGEVASGFGSL